MAASHKRWFCFKSAFTVLPEEVSVCACVRACVCVCVYACVRVCVCKNTEGHWGLYIWIYEQKCGFWWVFYEGHSKTLVIFVVYVYMIIVKI